MKGDKFDELAWPGVGSILPLLKDMSGTQEMDRDIQGDLNAFTTKINRSKEISIKQRHYDDLVIYINNVNRRKDSTKLGLIYTSEVYPVGRRNLEINNKKPSIIPYDLFDLAMFEKQMGLKLHQLHIGLLNFYTKANVKGGISIFNTSFTINLPDRE